MLFTSSVLRLVMFIALRNSLNSRYWPVLFLVPPNVRKMALQNGILLPSKNTEGFDRIPQRVLIDVEIFLNPWLSCLNLSTMQKKYHDNGSSKNETITQKGSKKDIFG